MKKYLLAVLFILLIGITSAYATYVYTAREISYTPEDQTWNVDNVQDAINELKVSCSNNSSSTGNCNCTANISKPSLGEGMLPVTIADDGTVTYISDNDANWYDYCNKKWANSVILVDTPSKTYNVGDTISESDIRIYLVYIPKYKYKLWNVGVNDDIYGPQEIDIVFDNINTTDVEGVSCATPLTSGASGNCNNGEYMTHPAFITLNKNGFWVSKFEVGYMGATSTSAAQVNSSDSTKIIAKPNTYSWRNITVYNAFVASYNLNRNLDTHMIKNTEWGAVAYLSHSRYGVDNEININNNSAYITGKSALNTKMNNTYPGEYGNDNTYNSNYNTINGYRASTTGNISGIYDMSGGSWEYMSSYRSETLGSSGFTTSNIASYDSKYFDIYNASSAQTTYQYRILGDATGEMGPIKYYKDADESQRYHNWYGDNSVFVDSSAPWFLRGGGSNNGGLAGAFYFVRDVGTTYTGSSFRLVLSV